jgi:hypothetical protein
MNENQKSLMYGDLLNKHTRVFNTINEIKGQNIELSQSQIFEIKKLEQRQVEIIRLIDMIMKKP